MRSWLTGRSVASSSASLHGPDEPQALENALHGASFIMNDDIEMAERELQQGSSSFHYLGLGLVGFMRAVLGFEKDMMADASKRLNEAESRASDSYRSSSRQQGRSQSEIYATGSEYLLCQAQTQIMGAVIGVLTESVTEAIKGFYKLRKAYITLDALLQQEKAWLEKQSARRNNQTLSQPVASNKEFGGKADDGQSKDSPEDSDSEAEEFYDVAEDAEEIPEAVELASRPSTAVTDDFEKMTIKSNGHASTDLARRLSSHMQEGPDADAFENFTDAFIHSSSSMCYGMLLLLLSLLPPAFSTLSKIAGFRGDRSRGIALLWQASKFPNLNGAFAGLILLGYYNGFIGFCDILPTEGSGSFPKQRCAELLAVSTQRFPKSCMWKLEQIRMLSNEKRLVEAIKMLEEMPQSNLLQLQALHCFEKAMTYMFLHCYEESSQHFHKMISLNNWSHGLYYYISACCQVELYRQALSKDPQKATEYAKEAERLFKLIPNHIGKKKIIGRQLPFDVFVQRKLDKWSQRAKEHNLPIVDAVGVSPVCEMIYFWNGYKKMNEEQLELCLTRLDWSKTSAKVSWAQEAIDEKGIRSLVAAVVLRNLGKTQEARDTLQQDIIDHPSTLFKGNLRDNWTPPAARYEMAATYWFDHLQSGDVDCLAQSQQLLETAAGWEAYDLDVRVGLRVKTGLETVRRRREALT